MGKDNNNPKPAKSNRSGRKAFSNSQLQPKTDCILRFKDPKPNDESIKAKFTESDRAEVSKQIRGWKTGDNEANLVALMNRLVSLGDMYEMWEDGKVKEALPNNVESTQRTSARRLARVSQRSRRLG